MASLFSYRQQVQRLLADLTMARFAPGDLDSYINTARGQVAGEGECIRVYGALNTVAGTVQYPFTSISLNSAGVAGVINVRMITFAYPGVSQQTMVTPREWEFFNSFILTKLPPTVYPVGGTDPVVGSAPSEWAQFGQGTTGTFFINVPDQAYALSLDTVCYPYPLAADGDTEAIPYLWTDAVPYFAAYLALLNAQNADGATGMLKFYQMFVARARQFVTPSVLPHQYSQAPDPEMAARLGMTARQ